MTKFATIPKTLPPRKSLTYEQKIPKIIWQTMKTNEVPAFMKSYADSWIDLNPEYEYRFCDDHDVLKFIAKDFPEYVEGYNNLKYGASKADLWRYLTIYKYGGVYADIDCMCINSLRKWINKDSTLVTALGTNNDICQWLIISVPKNPIFLRAAEKTLQNSLNRNCITSNYGFQYIKKKLVIREESALSKFNHPVLGLSGPPVLQQAAEECLREGTLSEILPATQVVCVSKSKSCQMNGNVRHDTGNEDYKKSYKMLQLNHYNDRWEKIKRNLGQFLLIKNN
jgi:mannosyltransferase OCH1-like enzyme